MLNYYEPYVSLFTCMVYFFFYKPASGNTGRVSYFSFQHAQSLLTVRLSHEFVQNVKFYFLVIRFCQYGVFNFAPSLVILNFGLWLIVLLSHFT